MAFNQASNAFDLLGQAIKPAAAVRLPQQSEVESPELQVGWGEFRQSLWSSVRALATRPFGLRKFENKEFFRDAWVERRIPVMALLAAALWHIVFVIFPFPKSLTAAHTNPSLRNFELTWSGPINDLPLLEIPGAKPKPTPRGEPNKPPPAEGADAFHPRQRIFTDPATPTHPRQTLINPKAPPDAPKILPELPNVVEMQTAAGPAKPRIEISEETLKKLRPRERRVATVTEAPLPDVPTLEQKPAEITMQASPNAPARPKLQLNAGVAPHVAQHAQNGEAEPAPEVGAPQPAANGNPAAFIALSAAPAPPMADMKPPAGNLAAQVAISPEGKKSGVPGGTANSATGGNDGAKGNFDSKGGTGEGSGKNPVGVSISGGNPTAKSGVSGLGSTPPRSSAPAPKLLVTRPEAHTTPTDAPERTAPPNFAALPPGAKPEVIFESKKVYTMYVNMANLNSATGSWVLHFSELRGNGGGPQLAAGEVSAPVVMKKTDPKYPPTLIDEHVEGQVVLYAVIRRDGSVDSIQLVRGLDPQLDANAMAALSHWKFTPATKQNEPIDLEAIVYIPFRAPEIR
jgi:TonB family protein